MSFENLQELISEALGVDNQDVTMESDLVSDLGADSLDAAELIMAIEDRFQLEISDDDAQKLKNVGEIWNYIKQKSGN